MAQIDREGRVVFHDASLHVWEEDVDETSFKKDVFKRIVQTLNRLGFTCIVPQDQIKDYGYSFATLSRYCVKGNLKADLSLGGRHIELKFFQNVNAPDRPDHEGRYQSDKEGHMPYLMRLEMERARRKIRDYLCNVFSGYVFKTDRIDGRSNKRGPKHLTAMEWLQGCYETSCHFKGDLNSYEISDYNNKSADGSRVNHGQRVWFADRKGRICTGVAYYNINSMWWVVTGKYDVSNEACSRLYTAPPSDIRRKRNSALRERVLKSLLAKSIKAEEFEKSILFRDLLSLDNLN